MATFFFWLAVAFAAVFVGALVVIFIASLWIAYYNDPE